MLDKIREIEEFQNVSDAVLIGILIVGALIILLAIFSLIISAWLAIKYMVYNRTKNSADMNGAEVARKILDDNGLSKIKVSVVGSLLFGNSYSHYFKKVRIRRLTNKKKSITSLAIGAEKASLALLDKEGDPDMKKRIALIPLTIFGPIAFIPLVIIGVLLDIIFFNTSGTITLVFSGIGLVFYLLSFILSIMVLKTEVKAQARALQVLKEENLATDKELDMMKSLFKLYNIQYVNDMIMAFLEMIYRVLMIVAKAQNSGSSRSSNN
jgi:hypothetical protein